MSRPAEYKSPHEGDCTCSLCQVFETAYWKAGYNAVSRDRFNQNKAIQSRLDSALQALSDLVGTAGAVASIYELKLAHPKSSSRDGLLAPVVVETLRKRVERARAILSGPEEKEKP